jgi:hypothetical protein
MKNIRIVGKRWFDKVNGNTYHSVRCYVDGVLVCAVPWQYGYGDQYAWTGWLELVKQLKLEVKQYENGSTEPSWQWCRDRGIDCEHEHHDGLKRDMVAWGVMPS